MTVAFDLFVRNCAELVTARGTLSPNQKAEAALDIIPRGAVGIAAGKVVFVGPEADVPPAAVAPFTEVVDADGGVVAPGLVDPHTHLVFAGERSAEFDLRNQGATYLEIAKAGGGIVSTVRATRAASLEELVALARPRLVRLLEQGVTTCEVKSGYGLDVETELKMLRAVQQLRREVPVDLVPTLLCAHAIPEEFKANREGYVERCIREIIPAVAREGLARFCDAFVEESAFTHDEARRIFEAARAHGMRIRLHADQLTANGGAQLAAEVGALSADHLEQVSDEGIAALARAGVTALLVPTSTLFLRMRPYAPGRKLVDAGVNVALGTNVNPGSSMTENVGVVLSLACLENGLSAAEALWGMTRGAAIALGLAQHGQLVEGGPADLVVFGCSTYRHLPYHLGVNHARVVVKGGRVVVRPGGAGVAVCR
ncbi:MAG: imidazolonepropionase [Myxococcaceae bacterium]|nr:imidazolonepropionase [Myxococcaceae bacterium]